MVEPCSERDRRCCAHRRCRSVDAAPHARPRRRSDRTRARRRAPAEIRRHQGFLRRLHARATRAACCASRSPSAGSLLVKKPGKMRWDYTAPGAEAVRLRRREDVLLHPAGQAGHRRRQCRPTTRPTTPTLFLAGKGNLTRDFTPSLVDAPAGMPRRQPRAEAGAQSPPAGLRLADARRRPGEPRASAAWSRSTRRAGHRAFPSRI